jgi:hypothetical protein
MSDRPKEQRAALAVSDCHKDLIMGSLSFIALPKLISVCQRNLKSLPRLYIGNCTHSVHLPELAVVRGVSSVFEEEVREFLPSIDSPLFLNLLGENDSIPGGGSSDAGLTVKGVKLVNLSHKITFFSLRGLSAYLGS